ncbi:MAG: HD domain-containing protein/phosphohydrolase [Treponematales bacterium]
MNENTQDTARNMNRYPVESLAAGCYFSKPAFLDDGRFLLTAPEIPFSEKTANALLEWGFPDVLSAGETRDEYISEKKPHGALSAALTEDGKRLLKAGEFYTGLLAYTETAFFQALIEAKLRFDSVAEKIKALYEVVSKDRRFLLMAQDSPELNSNEDYLASHSARTAIFSLIIGSYLKLPVYRLIELGSAALLHDIGMKVISSSVYLAARPLSPEERKSVNTHPILSANILKKLQFPLEVYAAALQHHERENGSGYPQQLPGSRIGLYGKIIAVACSYEEMFSERPYKEAKDPSASLFELFRNDGGRYDEAAVRALVDSLSFYPVGLSVLLSDGRKGRVVGAVPGLPQFPLVQVADENDPDGGKKIIATSKNGARITGLLRPMRSRLTHPRVPRKRAAALDGPRYACALPMA